MAKPGMHDQVIQRHAVICANGQPGTTAHFEQKLSKPALKVVLHGNEMLNSMSRLDYGKPTSIEHNQKIKIIGRLTDDSLVHARLHYDAVHRRQPLPSLAEPGP